MAGNGCGSGKRWLVFITPVLAKYSLGQVEGFCSVHEQPWVDLNPRHFALKATAPATAPRRLHTGDAENVITDLL